MQLLAKIIPVVESSFGSVALHRVVLDEKLRPLEEARGHRRWLLPQQHIAGVGGLETERIRCALRRRTTLRVSAVHQTVWRHERQQQQRERTIVQI